MFLTLTPNPCIERTFHWDHGGVFETQRVNSEAVTTSAGGKGLNAARVAARFGAKVVATGPVGRRQRLWLSEMCQIEGVSPDFVGVEADTRFCLNILHSDAPNRTEIIENGIPLGVAEGALLLEKWRDLLQNARLALIGGSYSPSPDAASDWHATLLCDLAAQVGVPVIYDGVGTQFSRALRSKTPPWAIKPNLEEAAKSLNRIIETPADERRAVRDLGRLGAKIVLLSCGARGLYLGHPGGIEWFEAPAVKTVSPVGSGDSLVGAFAARWLENGDIFEAARWGVAAGSACAAQKSPAFVTPGEAASLLSQVRHKNCEIALTSQFSVR